LLTSELPVDIGHCDEIQYPLFDLLHAIVIGIEDLPGPLEVIGLLSGDAKGVPNQCIDELPA
jgi:hypothetical protein